MNYLQIMKSDFVNTGDFSDEFPLSDVGDCNGRNKLFWNLRNKIINDTICLVIVKVFCQVIKCKYLSWMLVKYYILLNRWEVKRRLAKLIIIVICLEKAVWKLSFGPLWFLRFYFIFTRYFFFFRTFKLYLNYQ